MDKYTATEMAFKHGYEKGYDKGYEDARKWIPSSRQLPTMEDGDKYGRVLAIEYGYITCVNWQGPINYPDQFPFWMSMPEPPKEGK